MRQFGGKLSFRLFAGSFNRMSKQKKRIGSRVFGSKLTAILSISLVLVLFGIMIIIGLFAKDLSDTAKEHIRLTLVLDDNIKSAELRSLQQDLEKAPWANKFNYVSKDDALDELADELGENPLDLLGYNPLPASFEIYLDPEYARTDSIKDIEKTLKKKSFIQEIVYREELIDLVNSNILSIGRLLLGIALILTLISYMLIRNTVRLMIYSKRFLIHTMCLVGARQSFIRRPFVWENARGGIWGALIALGLLYLALSYLNSIFPGLLNMITTTDYVLIFVVMAVLGIVITSLATIFSVNRYLRMRSDDLYYI